MKNKTTVNIILAMAILINLAGAVDLEQGTLIEIEGLYNFTIIEASTTDLLNITDTNIYLSNFNGAIRNDNLTGDGILNLLNQNNTLLVFSNGTSIPVYGTNQEVNLTLAPNQYVYVYTNYTYDELWALFHVELCTDITAGFGDFLSFVPILILIVIAGGIISFLYGNNEVTDDSLNFGVTIIIISIILIIGGIIIVNINGGTC